MRIHKALIELVGRYTPGMSSVELTELAVEIDEDYVKQEGGKEWKIKHSDLTPEQLKEVSWKVKLKNFFESPYTRLVIMYLHFIFARKLQHWWLTAGQKSEEEIEEEIRREIEEQRDWRSNTRFGRDK